MVNLTIIFFAIKKKKLCLFSSASKLCLFKIMPCHNEKAKPNKWEEEGSGQRVELNLIMEGEQTRQVQRTQTVVTHMGVCVVCYARQQPRESDHTQFV